MRYSFVFIAAIAATVQAHGVITEIQGANGVTMPGLSVQDGTPRDCATPGCGSEADTSIIRTREMGGKASALGRTNGGGAVDAAAAISKFMGGATGGATTATSSTGTSTAKTNTARGLLDAFTGGNKAGGAKAGGATGAGVKTTKGAAEDGVSKAAGTGATSGLPTTGDDGSITMTFHQVNQDGAGPLTAAIDPSSGGTDPAAFQEATVMQNVPGIGVGGLSAATTTDFPVKVQMPAGMTCTGTSGGATNVCIVRMQNSALAGPFGGSAAFTQSKAAKKRAVEFNLRKMRMARGVLGMPE